MGSRFLALIAIAGCLSVSCTSGIHPGDEDDNEAITASGCGVERWSVKTGTDSSASQVNMTAQDTTIQALGAFPVPSGLGPGSSRFPNSPEMQLFRLTNVTLSMYKLESDSDFHIDVTDGAGHNIITEIPSPSCVSGGPWASQISAARAAFSAKYTPTGSFQTANVPVTITGVGFFDVPHGQASAAPNYLELHAVLSICFPGSSVSGCSASTPDFSLAASPASVTGSSAASSISVTGSGGFAGSVSFAASGLPAGASASFSPSSVSAGGTSTLTLTAGSAPAGTYNVTVTGTSGTNSHTATVSWTIGTTTTPDFSLSASPSSVTGSGSSTISVAGLNGFAGTVSLSQTGEPAGATASLSSPTAGAGGTSTLSLSAGSAAAGTYSVTVTGTSGTLTHSATVSWTISGGTTGGGTIVNGGFENGLTGWSSSGTTSVSNVAHSGSHSAQVGSATAAGGHSLAQTFTAPTGVGALSFWYQGVCNDTVQYAYASATLLDNTSATTTTLLPNTCTKTGQWVQVTSGTLTAGHSYTLTLSNHGEVYTTFYGYTLYDDVVLAGGSTGTPDFSLSASPSSVSGATGSSAISVAGSNGFSGSVTLSASGAPSGATASLSATSVTAGSGATLSLSAGSAAGGTYSINVTGSSAGLSHSASVSWTIPGGTTGGNPVVNGDFETGTLSGWTSAGGTSVVSTSHSGSFAAQVGTTTPSTDSSLKQTVTLPSGSPQLSLWYQVVCPDTVQYDWASVQVLSTSGAVLATPLGNTCSSTGSWAQATADLSQWAGTQVVISLNNHDDNYPGDPTYTLYDDVTISGGSTATPDFSLSLSSGTASGAASDTVNVTPSGGFSSAVALSASGVPSGASATFNPASVTSGSSTLTLSPGKASAGTYPITVTGSGGGVTHSASLSWTISATTTPDFSLSLSSGAVTSTNSAAATDSVTVTPGSGFTSAVALSVSGTPSGASASFNPGSVSSGSSTLTLTPGTAPNGTYSLTVSGSGGGQTHTAALSWTLSTTSTGGAIQTVFIILMENHNWSSISGSSSAPYINGTLLPQASYALNYVNVPGLHPSLPNYLWLEAGTNFGITADGTPATYHQSTTQHLVTLLQNAGISWKAYAENITGSTCPLTDSGLWATKHQPQVFFDDVTNSRNSTSANCIAHIRPFTQLATDLSSNSTGRYNFITPNLCDDMHGATGCPSNSISTGDTWLQQTIPTIMASPAYTNGGAIFITWDESEGGDVPIGMIVLSPKAKGHGYTNSIAYSHSSTLRSMEEIFSVSPMLGDAANATDLADLFTSFP